MMITCKTAHQNPLSSRFAYRIVPLSTLLLIGLGSTQVSAHAQSLFDTSNGEGSLSIRAGSRIDFNFNDTSANLTFTSSTFERLANNGAEPQKPRGALKFSTSRVGSLPRVSLSLRGKPESGTANLFGSGHPGTSAGLTIGFGLSRIFSPWESEEEAEIRSTLFDFLDKKSVPPVGETRKILSLAELEPRTELISEHVAASTAVETTEIKLAKIKDALAEAQSTLTQAQNALSNAQSALMKAETDFANADDATKSEKQKVRDAAAQSVKAAHETVKLVEQTITTTQEAKAKSEVELAGKKVSQEEALFQLKSVTGNTAGNPVPVENQPDPPEHIRLMSEYIDGYLAVKYARIKLATAPNLKEAEIAKSELVEKEQTLKGLIDKNSARVGQLSVRKRQLKVLKDQQTARMTEHMRPNKELDDAIAAVENGAVYSRDQVIALKNPFAPGNIVDFDHLDFRIGFDYDRFQIADVDGDGNAIHVADTSATTINGLIAFNVQMNNKSTFDEKGETLHGSPILMGLAVGYGRDNNRPDLSVIDGSDAYPRADFNETSTWKANTDIAYCPRTLGNRVWFNLFTRNTFPSRGDSHSRYGCGVFLSEKDNSLKAIGGLAFSSDSVDHLRVDLIAGYNF